MSVENSDATTLKQERPVAGWRARDRHEITLDLVVPVLNEAHVLSQTIDTLRRFLAEHVPYRWRLIIAENGSSDGTLEVATELAEAFAEVEVEVIGQAGRGRALRVAWSRSAADIVGYTDVDLSTDLEALPTLVDALIDGYDVAIGSRLAPGSQTTRSVKREIVSRGYNALLRLALNVRFSDAQTGFKFVTREVVEDVLPRVQDQGWFLDTELLVLSEAMGYRIADIPVTWREDDDSRVRIIRTAWDDVCGVLRVRRMLRSTSSRPEQRRRVLPEPASTRHP